MDIRIISKPDTPTAKQRLIFIFLGWGMDEKPFAALRKEGYTVAVGFRYDGSEKEQEQYREFISGFNGEIAVIAWSYGVAIANPLLTGRETVCVAVNGVVNPVDNKKGIPEKIFTLTLRNISEESMPKFYANTGGGYPTLPQRGIDSLKTELEVFRNLPVREISQYWTSAVIGMKDRIISPAAQLAHWNGSSTVELRQLPDMPHHIPLQDIIDTYIIDKEFVAHRFTENTVTYETEAEVQRNVANRLYDTVKTHCSLFYGKILEIGCGTGFLTRLYSRDTDTTRCTVIDLAARDAILDAFRRADVGFNGEIIEGDAERFMSEIPDSGFDTILSSSALQWFGNLPTFFRNLSRVLSPGGTAAIATYVRGTFSNIPGRTLRYFSPDEISAMIPDSMEILHTSTIEHTIRFKSARELLTHIRHTGVNAVSAAPYPPGDLRKLIATLESDPKLTFATMYLIIRKKP